MPHFSFTITAFPVRPFRNGLGLRGIIDVALIFAVTCETGSNDKRRQKITNQSFS